MKKGCLMILICALTSCHFYNYKVKFEVINDTEFVLDSLNITPNTVELLKYVSIKPEQRVEYIVDMSEALPIDGSYNLSYRLGNKVFQKKMGYYARGTPVDEHLIIKIEKDNIKFVSIEEVK